MENLLWPKQRELQFQMQIQPWLFLPRKFDALACYQEASQFLNLFVSHRKEAHGKNGEWKSLALKSIGGKSDRTQGYENYPVGQYEFTEIWEKCPATRKMLEIFTDPSQCERIRFMLLEPGAEIEVHNDAPEKFYSPALNFALNMPAGCEFWVDLNKDGSFNRYSKKIPIGPGSAFLFNSANYHRVANHSAEYRIHIIVHGPLKYSEEELLELARAQNGIEGAHASFSAVCKKRTEMGVVQFSEEQAADLFHLGVRPDSLPDFACLGILQPKLEDPLHLEEATRITQGSLHPLEAEFVPDRFLETWLTQNAQAGKEFALVVGAGTFFRSSHKFWLESMRSLSQMTTEAVPLMGHLLQKSNELPCLHPQFFLLHLPTWQKVGSPSFQEAKEFTFPGFERSKENVHCDYTPLSLWENSKLEATIGKANFGTAVLASLLKDQKQVKNVSFAIRDLKTYAYLEEGRGEHWWKVNQQVREFKKNSEARVYPFNTERLLVRDYRFQPELLLAPCAGLKPIALFYQWKKNGCSLDVKLLELNPLAIQFYQKLLEANDEAQCLQVLQEVVGQDFSSASGAKEYTRRMFDSVLLEGFESSFSNFLEAKRKFRAVVEFEQMDYLQNSEKIVSSIQKKKFFFWHSNAWQTNAAICTYGENDLRKNYRNLVEATMRARGCEAFTHKSIFEAIFGDFMAPVGVFTMGGKKKESPKMGAFERFSALEMGSHSL